MLHSNLTLRSLVAFGRLNGYTVRCFLGEFQAKPKNDLWDDSTGSVIFADTKEELYDMLKATISRLNTFGTSDYARSLAETMDNQL